MPALQNHQDLQANHVIVPRRDITPFNFYTPFQLVSIPIIKGFFFFRKIEEEKIEYEGKNWRKKKLTGQNIIPMIG